LGRFGCTFCFKEFSNTPEAGGVLRRIIREHRFSPQKLKNRTGFEQSFLLSRTLDDSVFGELLSPHKFSPNKDQSVFLSLRYRISRSLPDQFFWDRISPDLRSGIWNTWAGKVLDRSRRELGTRKAGTEVFSRAVFFLGNTKKDSSGAVQKRNPDPGNQDSDDSRENSGKKIFSSGFWLGDEDWIRQEWRMVFSVPDPEWAKALGDFRLFGEWKRGWEREFLGWIQDNPSPFSGSDQSPKIFAFQKKFGYLNSCPTNTNRGDRFSVWISRQEIGFEEKVDLPKIVSDRFGIRIASFFRESGGKIGEISVKNFNFQRKFYFLESLVPLPS
jgi:hypothetical protein